MQIGTIGAELSASVCKARAEGWVQVKISNNRGPESLREIVNQLGRGATAVPKEEAAACEMCFSPCPGQRARDSW